MQGATDTTKRAQMPENYEGEADALRHRIRELLTERDAWREKASLVAISTALNNAIAELRRRTEAAEAEVQRLREDIAKRTREYLTTKEAAAYLRLSVGGMNAARCRGSRSTPPFCKVGGRVLYERGELDAWMAKRRREWDYTRRDEHGQP